MSAQVVTLAAHRRQRMQAATERDSAEKLAAVKPFAEVAALLDEIRRIETGDLVCWRREPSRSHRTGIVSRIFPGGMVRVECAGPREFYTLPLGVLTVLKKGGGDSPSDTEPAA